MTSFGKETVNVPSQNVSLLEQIYWEVIKLVTGPLTAQPPSKALCSLLFLTLQILFLKDAPPKLYQFQDPQIPVALKLTLPRRVSPSSLHLGL